jgi:nitrogen-specific signal transduction histidine kinase
MEDKMDQKTENIFASKSPEQKLNTLTAELQTPIEVIRGYAYILKKDIESDQINPEDILKKISTIIEKAERIKELCLEAVRAQKG